MLTFRKGSFTLYVLCVCVLAALAACAGGGGHSALPPASTAASSAPGSLSVGAPLVVTPPPAPGQAPVTMSLTIPLGGAGSSSAARGTKVVPSNSLGVAIYAYQAGTAQPAAPTFVGDLTTTAPGLCTVVGSTKVCAITFSAPYGADVISLQLYDSEPQPAICSTLTNAGCAILSNANLLAGGQTVATLQNTNNNVTITLAAPLFSATPISPTSAWSSGPVGVTSGGAISGGSINLSLPVGSVSGTTQVTVSAVLSLSIPLSTLRAPQEGVSPLPTTVPTATPTANNGAAFVYGLGFTFLAPLSNGISLSGTVLGVNSTLASALQSGPGFLYVGLFTGTGYLNVGSVNYTFDPTGANAACSPAGVASNCLILAGGSSGITKTGLYVLYVPAPGATPPPSPPPTQTGVGIGVPSPTAFPTPIPSLTPFPSLSPSGGGSGVLINGNSTTSLSLSGSNTSATLTVSQTGATSTTQFYFSANSACVGLVDESWTGATGFLNSGATPAFYFSQLTGSTFNIILNAVGSGSGCTITVSSNIPSTSAASLNVAVNYTGSIQQPAITAPIGINYFTNPALANNFDLLYPSGVYFLFNSTITSVPLTVTDLGLSLSSKIGVSSSNSGCASPSTSSVAPGSTFTLTQSSIDSSCTLTISSSGGTATYPIYNPGPALVAWSNTGQTVTATNSPPTLTLSLDGNPNPSSQLVNISEDWVPQGTPYDMYVSGSCVAVSSSTSPTPGQSTYFNAPISLTPGLASTVGTLGSFTIAATSTGSCSVLVQAYNGLTFGTVTIPVTVSSGSPP